MKTLEQPEIRKFLSTIKDRISFREAHSEVEKELSLHLEDLIEERAGKGEIREEAIQSAIKQMGDPEEIGSRLNQVHTPQLPWLLLLIVAGMVGLGIFNVLEFNRIGSHSVNILIGVTVGVLLYWAKPSQVSKAGWFVLAAGLAFLGGAAIWGEKYEGVLYVKFLYFNIDAAGITLAPFILALGGLIGRAKSEERLWNYVLAAVAVIPIIGLALIGSTYGAILCAVAALAMMVAASFRVGPIFLAVLVNAVTIASTAGPQKFLSAEGFAAAKTNEAHTDFVLSYFHNESSLLGALGLFLAMALVAQLGTLLMQVRSRFSRVMVAGHLSVIALGITWSVLANLGYVAMPGTGAPLPFVSYGGSFLIGQMALVGMSVGLYWRRTLSLPC